jgi:hypothetical protein
MRLTLKGYPTQRLSDPAYSKDSLALASGQGSWLAVAVFLGLDGMSTGCATTQLMQFAELRLTDADLHYVVESAHRTPRQSPRTT